MDYYQSSYSNSGGSRGRYQSRGSTSYRGGGGRGDYNRGGSRGYNSRGNYSRGRGSSGGGGMGGIGGSSGSYYPKPHYDNSGSKYSSENKYGSHERFNDSPYRKSESSSYLSSTSRDHSHHRSEMEMPRKRMRTDNYSPGNQIGYGSMTRRSHDGDDYRSSRSYVTPSSYPDSRSYGDSRSVFKKPRMEYKPKEEFRPRKEFVRPSVGGAGTRLRTFRGRPPRGRFIAGRGDFMMKRRGAYSRPTSTTEYLALRRAKMLRMRRLKMQRDKITRDLDELDKKEGSKSGEEEEDEDDATAEKGEDDDDKDEDLDNEGEEKEKIEKKKKEDGELDEESDATEIKEKVKKEEVRTDFFGKPFMKLQCPQCSAKAITFKEYVQHLYQPSHVKAMRDKSLTLKNLLAKMRMAQRAKQKKADEDDLTSMTTKTMFCPICKLNYSQDRVAHLTSEAHKKMKNFLLPYCRVCRLTYKSPMLYENHVCSLDHIRRKHKQEERLEKSGPGCLDNFMVLDSVGSGDEVEEAKEDEVEEEAKPKDADLNLGVEYIRKVEVLYCELCRCYLPRANDNEKILNVHCRSKNHLRCYLRFGNDELLERIQGKEIKIEKIEEKTTIKKEVKDEAVEAKEKVEGNEESTEDDVGMDDKLWADVGDLLSQVEPGIKSDDEDEEEGGRFDRFKSNEKKEKENGEVAIEGVVKQATEEGAATNEEAQNVVAKTDA